MAQTFEAAEAAAIVPNHVQESNNINPIELLKQAKTINNDSAATAAKDHVMKEFPNVAIEHGKACSDGDSNVQHSKHNSGGSKDSAGSSADGGKEEYPLQKEGGKKANSGKDISDSLGKVLHKEVDGQTKGGEPKELNNDKHSKGLTEEEKGELKKVIEQLTKKPSADTPATAPDAAPKPAATPDAPKAADAPAKPADPTPSDAPAVVPPTPATPSTVGPQ